MSDMSSSVHVCGYVLSALFLNVGSEWSIRSDNTFV